MSFDPAAWIQNRFFTLRHEYDPVYAKEYYERTKELKGRKKAAPKPPPGTVNKLPDWVTATKEVEDTTNYIDKAKAAPAKPTSNAAALREAATKRQAMLRERLERLESILADLVAQAQEAAGVKKEDTAEGSKEKEKSSEKKEKEKPKTAAEKKEAAKKAKEDYEKNKDPETNESAQALQDKIEEVQKKIADARADLRAAIERAKAMSKPPKTPTKAAPTKASTQSSSGVAKASPPNRANPSKSTGAEFGRPTQGRR